MPRSLTPLLLVVLALVVAGCGSDDDSSNDQGSATSTTTATTTTATTETTETTTGEAPPPDDDATAPAVENASDLGSKPRVATPSGPTPAGLVTKDLVVGTGPAAKTGDAVSVHYVGLSFSNGEEFDSSWGKGEPFTFTLGEGLVIPGWEQGVVGMKVGGRRELVIPPDLGYGATGNPDGGILPNETLVFVVDLKKIGS